MREGCRALYEISFYVSFRIIRDNLNLRHLPLQFTPMPLYYIIFFLSNLFSFFFLSFSFSFLFPDNTDRLFSLSFSPRFSFLSAFHCFFRRVEEKVLSYSSLNNSISFHFFFSFLLTRIEKIREIGIVSLLRGDDRCTNECACMEMHGGLWKSSPFQEKPFRIYIFVDCFT